MRQLLIFILLAVNIIATNRKCAVAAVADTTQKDSIFLERAPQFPGGVNRFYKYLSKNLKYPPVALLIGINGNLTMSFIVDKDGYVRDASPENCIGAGCEAEAAELLKASPQWLPGIYKGKPTRVLYRVPIAFNVGKDDSKVTMKSLRNSNYGFIFQIKGKVYSIDEAEAIIGKNFRSSQIQEAAFYGADGLHAIKDKKETYILVMKGA